jgi:hypothetical protein
MVHFDCAHWEKVYGKAEYPIWVWPDMVFHCEEFVDADANALKVYELEQQLKEKDDENAKLKKALSKG